MTPKYHLHRPSMPRLPILRGARSQSGNVEVEVVRVYRVAIGWCEMV
jgi:hypothetical protein